LDEFVDLLYLLRLEFRYISLCIIFIVDIIKQLLLLIFRLFMFGILLSWDIRRFLYLIISWKCLQKYSL